MNNLPNSSSPFSKILSTFTVATNIACYHKIHTPMLLLFWLVSSSCYSEILVVMHASAKIDQLSYNQVKMLYLGKNKKLSDDTVANIVDHHVNNPLRDEFYRKATHKSTAKSVRIWARYMFSGKGKPPTVAKNDAEVIEILERFPHSSIGYIKRENLSDKLKIVHVLP